MNLFRFLCDAAARYPHRQALISDPQGVTYSELLNTVDTLSAFLCRLNTKPGDRIGILSRNSIPCIALLFALARTGLVSVPLNFRLSPADIHAQAEFAGIDHLFYETEFAGKAPFHLPCIKTCMAIGDRNWNTHLSAGISSASIRQHRGGESTCCILFTSGTSGTPKATALTHHNLIWNTLNYTAAYGLCPRDRELFTTPLFHSAGFGRMFTYIFNGVTVYLCARFDPVQCLKTIEARQITSLTQAPTMYKMMIRAAERTAQDLSSVKRVVTGASEMDRKTADALMALFPKAAFYNLYGLTEASPGVSILLPPDFADIPHSLGKPMLTVRVAVVDEQGGVLPADTIGEICCAGPNVMKGYYQHPEATQKVLRNGWLRTGDMGYVDSRGYLYLSGRKKEIIVSGGVNIYPADIEAVLLSHDAVLEAAAAGIPDDIWGERPAAAVVVKEGRCFSEAALLAFCRKNLPGFKCPVRIVSVEKLPGNASGKMLRSQLKL